MERTIRFQLNGRSQVLTIEPDRMPLWVRRSDLAMTPERVKAAIRRS